MTEYANGLLTWAAWLAIAVYLWVNTRRIGYLKEVKTTGKPPAPSVTFVIPVRNEAEHLQEALTRLAALDYPNYNIILVNDASTDDSGRILAAFVAADSRFSAIETDSLPAGWIGKSYALYRGYQQSRGEWLMFTDADVRFSPDSLGKAIAYCQQTGTAHLTILPQICSRSAMVNCVNAVFQLLLHLRYRPWAVANPASRAYLGMGAFNLVNRDAYEAMGTHARFALHPNDDLKLGQHIKKAGFRQQVLFGRGAISYEWYSSLPAFIQGLTKNAFSSVNYDLAQVLFSSIGAVLLFVIPVPSLVFSGKPELQLIGLGILATQGLLLAGRKGADGRWWHALMLPFSALVISYIMLRSAWLTLCNKGLYWSNRFYRLSDLKKWR